MTVFLVCFLSLVIFCAYMSYKFRNPYKLRLVFGKKGSGKTTFLVKKAVQAMRKGYTVYSTVYIPGAHLFDVDLVGRCTFPPESVVFIDEVGMIWDNRNFKAFRPDVRNWFKLQRHYHVSVWLFSQAADIDLKLRQLMDEMYLCNCHMGFISVARKIRRMITIVHPSGDSEARITDDIDFVPLWFSLFGAKSAIFTYIPNWVRYFDSFDAPPLPVIESVYQEIPERLETSFISSPAVRLSLSFLAAVRELLRPSPAALARGRRGKHRRISASQNRKIKTHKRFTVHKKSKPENSG